MVVALLCATAMYAFATPAAAPAAAAKTSPLKLEPYMVKLADGSELAAERGTFSVPEDRNNPRSRRIDIGFVRFKSTNPNPGAPLVYLAGGPGGSGVATARGPRQPVFLALRAVGDVIAFDQRGTGFSNHIPPCTALRKLDPSVTLTEAALIAYHRETLGHCLGQWRAAGVAVNGYTTRQSSDDIEQLRRVLGANKIDLWAISYGTHLALETMRRHPNSIGRVVLSSAEGMDQAVKLPAHVERAFARIEGAMPRPGLGALMRRVHARYDAEPQIFTLNPKGGQAVTFRADSFPLRMMAGIVPKNPDGIAQLAGAYGALDAGQTAPIAPLLYGFFYQKPLTMTGMTELMDVASGITSRRLALVRSQAPTALLGAAINFPTPHLRDVVPGIDLGDRFRREVRSNLPTLVLSGDLDPRTPLEEQAVAIAGLRNRHQVIVRNGGHDLFEAHPDIPRLMVDFFSGRPLKVRELTLAKPAITSPRP
jgi:pimeloyl-ACP methyl ester carboxylesterase